jgi:hypothetical protein
MIKFSWPTKSNSAMESALLGLDRKVTNFKSLFSKMKKHILAYISDAGFFFSSPMQPCLAVVQASISSYSNDHNPLFSIYQDLLS